MSSRSGKTLWLPSFSPGWIHTLFATPNLKLYFPKQLLGRPIVFPWRLLLVQRIYSVIISTIWQKCECVTQWVFGINVRGHTWLQIAKLAFQQRRRHKYILIQVRCPNTVALKNTIKHGRSLKKNMVPVVSFRGNWVGRNALLQTFFLNKHIYIFMPLN